VTTSIGTCSITAMIVHLMTLPRIWLGAAGRDLTLPLHAAGDPLVWDDGGVATDGCLWKYWSDAVRGSEGKGRAGAAPADGRARWGLVPGLSSRGRVCH
jgi:hypothetical protein